MASAPRRRVRLTSGACLPKRPGAAQYRAVRKAAALVLRLLGSLALAGCAGAGGSQAGADHPAGGSTTSGQDAAARAGSGGLDAAAHPAGAAILRSFVFVGGYTNAVRRYRLDRQSGALSELGAPVDLGDNPTYITPSADGRFLYVANEQDGAGGGVTVGQVNLDTGEVAQIDHEPGDNVGMVYTSVDPGGRHVLAASYDGARVQVFPIEAGGGLGAAVDTLSFAGGAQTHAVRVDASSKYAFIPNKGLDAVAQCTYDADGGDLELNPAGPALIDADGTGPRHLAFHPNGKWLYVINELSSTLSAYSLRGDGTLAPITSVSTLAAGFSGNNTGAHVLVHPSGRTLYASNRGEDTIAVYAIGGNGAPQRVASTPARGKTPRDFALDDTGQWLIVANQDSGSLAVFRVAPDGSLEAVGDPITGLSNPAAVAIVNVR